MCSRKFHSVPAPAVVPKLPTPEGDLLVTHFTFAFAEILGVNPARTGPRSYRAEQHEQWNVSAVSH